MKPELMNDLQLATCVDEFFKRTVQSIRNAGIETMIQLRVNATQYSKDGEYEIKHTAVIGSYEKQNSSETNNLMRSAHNAASQWLADALDAPTKVRPLIEYQPDNNNGEEENELATAVEIPEAEFTSVPEQPNTGDDESPI